ncbi:MAG: ABC transporter ATP-binding protein [Lachnospiraceae bacterium]|nr:ABC transporter ATP-binding protein [Lachnospiraceae bacterium]
MVEVKHLRKTYGDKTAVSDISFTLEKGRIYGLLGRNGAGKSTTMNMMTGYLAPDSGDVTIDGHDIFKEATAAKRCLGYLPEIPPLYNDMTVREYLLFAAQLKGMKKKAERTAEAERVEGLCGIDDVKDRLIKNLSKGYRQRVGLAQALIGNPELIILDEPTVGLDPKQIQEIRELISSLKEDHIVLLSSHILSEVSEVCDHIIIIDKGRVLLKSDTEDIASYTKRAETVEVTALGTAAEGEEVLSALNSVSAVQTAAGPEEGSTVYTVTAAAGTDIDIRPEISKALADAGFTILEMKKVGDSLEDIFLELTKPQEAPAVEENTESDSVETETEDESVETETADEEPVSIGEGSEKGGDEE